MCVCWCWLLLHTTPRRIICSYTSEPGQIQIRWLIGMSGVSELNDSVQPTTRGGDSTLFLDIWKQLGLLFVEHTNMRKSSHTQKLSHLHIHNDFARPFALHTAPQLWFGNNTILPLPIIRVATHAAAKYFFPSLPPLFWPAGGDKDDVRSSVG